VKQRKLIVASAMFAAGAMALTACGGSDGDGGGSTNSSAAVTIFNVKPQNPLVPANTNETGGGNILQNVFRGLVRYNPDTAAPEMAMAESIESKDNKVWTVKLKSGQTFQDNTPVTAASFVNAWNWGAYGPNGALSSYFFASIAGFDAVNPSDPDGESGPKKAPKPKTDKLSGLKVDSDTQFTVTLSSPASYFPTSVGYTAFAPLPEVFYKDVKAFGKKPIGNGPFQITAGDGDAGFTLEKWTGYKGPDVPKIAKATFKTYTSPEAAYSDLIAGNLDFMDQVPPSALVNNQFEKDLPGRTVNKPNAVIGTTTFPLYDPKYKDPNLHKAISMAIDREAITKSVFNGGRIPATGWVSPIVDGYKAGACGEFCTFNPTKAKDFLNKSAFKGPFLYTYNNDGPGNKDAGEAICNQIKNNLGVPCQTKAYVDQNTSRADISARKMKGMFRTAWQMDYPSIQNFLEPLYATGAGSNDGEYKNPKFDALLRKAAAEPTEQGLATYQEAERVLAEDMSIIPMWYYASQAGWSERLGNVKVTPFSTLSLADLTVK
jgi:oligopeptide transport system substrate-binding protein